jgi:glucose dehydrogenase
MPGNHGGGQYGTGAVDPDKGLFYVSDIEQVALLKDIPNEPLPEKNQTGGYQAGETFTNHWKMTDCCGFLREPGTNMPDNSMPWSTLTAYDMNKGTKLWQIPFGELQEYKEKGYPHSGLLLQNAKMTLTLSANGMLFSALSDKKFRVYDTSDGHVITERDTTGFNAGPVAIFEARGKEYVLIATSGTATLGGGRRAPQAEAATGAGLTAAPPVVKAAYTAYALPDGVK